MRWDANILVSGVVFYEHSGLGRCNFLDSEADINNRIVKMWNALMGLFEAKELYDERYEQLMRDKRILL
jgi:hypothetical protein